MKRIYAILILSISSMMILSCSSTNANRSYDMAAAGQYNTTLSYMAKKEDLRRAMTAALTAKKWNLAKDGDAIKAYLNSGGISANLRITFEDDMIHIDSRGSTAKGKPIVPLNWIEHLNSATRKYLARIQTQGGF